MRVLLLVVDGLGIGCLPDYLKFSNTYTNTLSDVCEGLSIPNLQKLGLLNLVKKEYSLNDDNVESYGRLGMLCKDFRLTMVLMKFWVMLIVKTEKVIQTICC